MNVKSGWEGEGMDGLLLVDNKLWSACTWSVIHLKSRREMPTRDGICSLLMLSSRSP
jgi:hypothetical protein